MRVGLCVALLAIAILSTGTRAEVIEATAGTLAVLPAIDSSSQVAAAKSFKTEF
jgi:hypothetical protein